MDVYIYQADIYCVKCGDAICDQLTIEGFAPEDLDDESTYDSDDYPKGPYPNGGGEADYPQHCGSGATCEDAIEPCDEHKIGCDLCDLGTNEVLRKATAAEIAQAVQCYARNPRDTAILIVDGRRCWIKNNRDDSHANCR